MEDFKKDEKTGKIPMIEFADMDRDGMTDLVFYRDGQVFTYYNQY